MKEGRHDVAEATPADSSSNFLARSQCEKFQIGLPPVVNISPLGTC